MQGIKEKTMSFWQILGKLAISNDGETIQRVSDETYVSNTGVTYTQMGPTTIGMDDSVFTLMGSHGSDGSTRMGDTATGLGAVFNDEEDW